MRNIHGIFEKMVDDMCGLNEGGALLDSCMDLREEAIRRIPLRYRIIALGFVKHFSLEELNVKLKQQGCPQLYSRNFWEATLIFAFKNGYTYDAWKHIQSQCADIYASLEDSSWFHGKKITYDELERYVIQNSDQQSDVLATQMRTRYLEHELSCVTNDVRALQLFLTENIHSFSPVREKTRYYFCKYLYYYLNTCIEEYLRACQRGRGVDEALSKLLALKVVTALRRNQRMPEDEKRRLIQTSAISCGEIFDEFNYFFFGYVALDWVEILMECYQNVDELPAAHRERIAAIFRKGNSEYKKLSDNEVIHRKMREIEQQEDASYALDGNRGYGKNRAGEHAVYKYIQGTLDIDRTALICFLLFFSHIGNIPAEHRLTVDRLQEILLKCGYTPLNIEDDFDWFVVEFLESKHPLEFLTEVMLDYAKHNENSFLYHLYKNSVHYEDELMQVMINAGKAEKKD